MSGLHSKNALMAVLVGLAVFALLLRWAPLRTGQETEKPHQTVQDRNQEQRPIWFDQDSGDLDDLGDLNKIPPFSNDEKEILKNTPTNDIDPETLKDLCIKAEPIQKNPRGVKYIKFRMRNHGTKEEGESLVNTLTELISLMNRHCENGKPRQ